MLTMSRKAVHLYNQWSSRVAQLGYNAMYFQEKR